MIGAVDIVFYLAMLEPFLPQLIILLLIFQIFLALGVTQIVPIRAVLTGCL
jgi:hypothetical protein